jgi:hypothetical protein
MRTVSLGPGAGVEEVDVDAVVLASLLVDGVGEEAVSGIGLVPDADDPEQPATARRPVASRARPMVA